LSIWNLFETTIFLRFLVPPEPLWLSVWCWDVSRQLWWVYGRWQIRRRTVRFGEDSKNPTNQIFALGHPAIALSNANGNMDAYTSNDQIFDGPTPSDDKKVTSLTAGLQMRTKLKNTEYRSGDRLTQYGLFHCSMHPCDHCCHRSP